MIRVCCCTNPHTGIQSTPVCRTLRTCSAKPEIKLIMGKERIDPGRGDLLNKPPFSKELHCVIRFFMDWKL